MTNNGVRLARMVPRAPGTLLLRALGSIVLVVGAPLAGSAATYYFSGAGNDLLGNGSAAKPWKTIDKFNQLNLDPGDSALFRAGDSFSGRMWLDETDAGTSAAGRLIAPVRIGSYGAAGSTTRATIISPHSKEGFVAYNAGGVELRDLEFVSGGFAASSRTNGVQFLSDKTRSSSLLQLEHVRVNNVVSRGFGLSGLQVWAGNTLGFANVHVADSEFTANGYAGVYVGATQWQNKFHASVIVERVKAHHNPGYVGDLPYTGHGVVMANVDGGVIQDSMAYNNGRANGHANMAMMTHHSNAITIQRNLAYGNRAPGGWDGGAFDLDGGVTNSIIQYNQSYDNDGAGLLLGQFDGANAMSKNLFRYNLSVNDGRGKYGGITVWGANPAEIAYSAVFHNNTVVVDQDVVPNAKGAVWFANGNHGDLDFVNNSLVALNGAALIAGDTSASKATFLGNSYWTDGAPITLEDRAYSSVQSWALGNMQERIGNTFVGVTGDPQFLDELSFRPIRKSPLVDAARTPGGVPWPSWATSLGTRDLASTPLYQGSGPDIGAWEYSPSDFNGDIVVDADDLGIWRTAFGKAETGLAADGNGDGRVDGSDFLIWQRHLASPGAASLAAYVPEPGAVGSLLMALAAPIVRSGRRSRWTSAS
jgi:hypothetical protein